MSERRQPCLQTQVNRRVPDFFCTKDAGHNAGHIDPASGKVWGTPRRPYGVRGNKTSRKRKTK